MKRIAVLLLALALAFPAFAEGEPLAGEITAVDRHGNAETSLSASELFARWTPGDLLAIRIGDRRVTAPLVDGYSDVNVGEPLVYPSDEGMVAFAVNFGSFQDTYSASPGTPFTLELSLAGGYLDRYAIRHLAKSESRGDYASDEVFANFRPVVEGALYRGCSPVLRDDARAPYAMALVKSAGIRAVVNLAQTPGELPAALDPYGGLPYVAVGMSADVLSADFAPALKEALRFIMAEEGPYYVHCNEGKDRAGVVCALIEGLLGRAPEQIVEDYMVSYENYFGVEKGTERYALLAGQIETIMEALLGAPMNADTLKGNVERYLADVVGVSPDDLRARLEP